MPKPPSLGERSDLRGRRDRRGVGIIKGGQVNRRVEITRDGRLNQGAELRAGVREVREVEIERGGRSDGIQGRCFTNAVSVPANRANQSLVGEVPARVTPRPATTRSYKEKKIAVMPAMQRTNLRME